MQGGTRRVVVTLACLAAVGCGSAPTPPTRPDPADLSAAEAAVAITHLLAATRSAAASGWSSVEERPQTVASPASRDLVTVDMKHGIAHELESSAGNNGSDSETYADRKHDYRTLGEGDVAALEEVGVTGKSWQRVDRTSGEWPWDTPFEQGTLVTSPAAATGGRRSVNADGTTTYTFFAQGQTAFQVTTRPDGVAVREAVNDGPTGRVFTYEPQRVRLPPERQVFSGVVVDWTQLPTQLKVAADYVAVDARARADQRHRAVSAADIRACARSTGESNLEADVRYVNIPGGLRIVVRSALTGKDMAYDITAVNGRAVYRRSL